MLFCTHYPNNHMSDQNEAQKIAQRIEHIAKFGNVYVGINITNVAFCLEDTPYSTTEKHIMKVIDSFVTDKNVINCYNSWSDFSLSTSADNNDHMQDEDNNLRFEYECSLLDAFKSGLHIPDEDETYDTHTVCYDAICYYDESDLVNRETYELLLAMADEKVNCDVDDFLESVVILQEAEYIESADGDVITWANDLVSRAAAHLYMAAVIQQEFVKINHPVTKNK